MFRKILVPVDLSDCASNSLRYALKFARFVGCPKLTVVHVYMPQVDSEYPNFIPPATDFTRFKEKQLDEFMESIPEFENAAEIHVSREIWLGFPADELLRHSGEFDAIIMSTTGEKAIMDKVFGSVSSAVAQRATCPVILVPPDVAFQPIYRLLYAGRFEAADPRVIEQLLTFNSVMKAHLHIVQVNSEGERQVDAEKEAIFTSLMKNGEPSFAFELAEIEGDAVPDALSDYAMQHRIELIVLATRKRNLLESIFHQSQTRQLLRIARQPLVVLHLPE